MIALAVALVGAIVWVGLRHDAAPATFVVGALLATAVAWATGLPRGGRLAPSRLLSGAGPVLVILGRFARDLVAANWRQLRLILSPRRRPRPRWIHFTTRLERPSSRIALAVLISLTPGTVTAHLRDDEYVIHVLDAAPEEDPLAEIRERFEELLLRLEGKR